MFLSGIVLDSPFSDIKIMIQDVAYQAMKLPQFLVTIILSFLSSQIKDRLHFDILEMKPIEWAKECSVPCLFIIGKYDQIVLPKRIN